VLPKTHTHAHTHTVTHPSILKITLIQLSRETLTAQQNTSETDSVCVCVCVCVTDDTLYTAPLVQQMARDIKHDLASGTPVLALGSLCLSHQTANCVSLCLRQHLFN